MDESAQSDKLQLHRSLVTFALENQNIIEHVQAQHN
jgi:hypothetical protein